jgi:hypothetical protein
MVKLFPPCTTGFDQGLRITRKKPDGSTENSVLEVDDGIDGIVGTYRQPQRDYWETKAV